MSNFAPTIVSHLTHPHSANVRPFKPTGNDWFNYCEMAKRAAQDSDSHAAEELFLVALDSAIRTKAAPLIAAQIHQYLAEICYTDERLLEAARHCQYALTVGREVLGHFHPKVADCLNLLGSIEFAKQDYDAAAIACLEALRIFERAKGQSHSDVIVCLFNMAVINEARTKFIHAENFYRRALMTSRANGADRNVTHQRIVDAYSRFLTSTNRKNEAEQLQAHNQ